MATMTVRGQRTEEKSTEEEQLGLRNTTTTTKEENGGIHNEVEGRTTEVVSSYEDRNGGIREK